MSTIKNKQVQVILFLYLTMIIGLLVGEDLLGAAEADYGGILVRLNVHREDFNYFFKNYIELDLRHSPVFQIFHIIVLNLFENDFFFRIINLHLNLVMIIIFYLSLKIQLVNFLKKDLLAISAIFFLIPTFRSYSIWPDSFLCGFLFFMLSIYFLLKFINSKQNKNYFAYLNIISLAISSYISPNFFTFSFFYLFIFFQHFNVSKNLLKIILLNIFLSLPAIYYIFIMENNFIDFDGDIWVQNINTISMTNLANKIIILPTIFILYFLPFLIINVKNIKKNFFLEIKKLNILHYFLIILPLPMLRYFSYSEINSVLGGGGLFYNLLKFFNYYEVILSLVSSISILIILLLTNNSLKSKIFLICLILSSPQLTIYTSYFDLVLFISIFLIMNEGLLRIDNLFNKVKIIKVFFFYYFLILSLYVFKNQYYAWMQ